MKLKIEDRRNRIDTAEMWMHKPRWRRHYQHQLRRKYNFIAFTLLKMSADDFWRMTKSHRVNNDIKNSTSYDVLPHLHWHYSSPSYLTNELIMNNTLNSDLLSPLLIKNEKVTKPLEEIVIQQSLTTIFNAKKNCHSASNTLYTSSSDSEYLELNSSLAYKHDGNRHSIADSALNESFVYDTCLDTTDNLSHNVNVTIKKEQKNKSLMNILYNKSNSKNDHVNLKLSSCNNIENITIYLNDINTSRYHIDKDCYRTTLKDNTSEKCETIFVFIQEENVNLQKHSNRDRYFGKYRNISTSTSDISPCICNENRVSRIIDYCPICSCNKKPTLVRYTMPTCIVKDVEQFSRYKNNLWNHVLNKTTAKNDSRHTPSKINLKVTQSLSSLTMNDNISFDNCGSSSTSSSTSFDENQISPMKLIHTTMHCPEQSIFRLSNSTISSVFSTSLLSIPPLIPPKKSKRCAWRRKLFPRACNFSSIFS